MSKFTGRKPKMVMDTGARERFLRAVEIGLPIIQCCASAGICEGAFYGYCRKAERDIADGLTIRQSAYIKFVQEVKEAKAKFAMKHLMNISNSADTGTWQASAWLLERRMPDDFGEKPRGDGEVSDGAEYVDNLKGFK